MNISWTNFFGRCNTLKGLPQATRLTGSLFDIFMIYDYVKNFNNF